MGKARVLVKLLLNRRVRRAVLILLMNRRIQQLILRQVSRRLGRR